MIFKIIFSVLLTILALTLPTLISYRYVKDYHQTFGVCDKNGGVKDVLIGSKRIIICENNREFTISLNETGIKNEIQN